MPRLAAYKGERHAEQHMPWATGEIDAAQAAPRIGECEGHDAVGRAIDAAPRVGDAQASARLYGTRCVYGSGGPDSSFIALPRAYIRLDDCRGFPQR